MKQLQAGWVVLAVALVGLGGCSRGPKTYPVTGTVKMDGQPLADARVTFSDPSLSHTAVGMTDSAGSFALAYLNKTGAPEGNYKVSISKMGPSESLEGLFVEQIPSRYNSATTLTAQVQKGDSNVFAFDHLTSEKDELDEKARGPGPAKVINGSKKNQDSDQDDALLKQLDRSKGGG